MEIIRRFKKDIFSPRKPYYDISDVKPTYPYIYNIVNEKLGLYNIDNTTLLSKIKLAYIKFINDGINNVSPERVFELYTNMPYYMIVIRNNTNLAKYLKIYVCVDKDITTEAFICDIPDIELIKAENLNITKATFYLKDDNSDIPEFISIILNVNKKDVNNYQYIISVINHELTHAVHDANNRSIMHSNTGMQNLTNKLTEIFKGEPDYNLMPVLLIKKLYNSANVDITALTLYNFLCTCLYYLDYSERYAFLHIVPELLSSKVLNYSIKLKVDTEIYNFENTKLAKNYIVHNSKIMKQLLEDTNIYQLYFYIKQFLLDIQQKKKDLVWPNNYKSKDFIYDYNTFINVKQQAKSLDFPYEEIKCINDLLELWIMICDNFMEYAVKIAINYDELNYEKLI